MYQTELRMHKRVSVDLAIEYILNVDGYIKEKDTGKGRVHNISQGGILFSSDIIFPYNKLIEIIVYIPDDRIKALAQVAWCKEIGSSGRFQIGLRFVDLSSGNHHKLAKYLQNLPI